MIIAPIQFRSSRPHRILFYLRYIQRYVCGHRHQPTSTIHGQHLRHVIRVVILNHRWDDLAHRKLHVHTREIGIRIFVESIRDRDVDAYRSDIEDDDRIPHVLLWQGLAHGRHVYAQHEHEHATMALHERHNQHLRQQWVHRKPRTVNRNRKIRKKSKIPQSKAIDAP